MITDSHCHLYWKNFDDDRDEVIARARAAGVKRMIVVGCDVESSQMAFELAASELDLYPTAGIHPHDACGATEDARATIEALCARPECVAVGETGLDFFRDHSSRSDQIESFHWQLDLARRLELPVIVHSRDAHEETARILSAYGEVRGVMHCYTMGSEELTPYLAAGMYISFSGVVTYPKNDANRLAAAAVPLDRILIETDCPYLAPQPMRGKRNEPAFVTEVLRTIAEVRKMSAEELAEATHANTRRLFALP